MKCEWEWLTGISCTEQALVTFKTDAGRVVKLCRKHYDEYRKDKS